ncbi:hypothetical protein B0H11DRAFT_2035224 [Mycena galericulata]|nr:hypothetical protein B0H11DRAFT_2035224 [Mycena galericulata]
MPVLPTEIIHHILLDLATPFEQAQMCLVCWRFNDIAVPVLYKHITLGSLKMTKHCCQTVLRRRIALAHCVRSFVVSPVAGNGEEDALDLIPWLQLGLRAMHRLEHLHLWIPSYDDNLFDALGTLTLPSLRRFGCHQPEEPRDETLVSFLERHTALTHLEIIRPWGYSERPKRRHHIFLPRLESYRGSASYFERIAINFRRLAHASFWDIPYGTSVQDLLRALAAATSAKIPFSLRILSDRLEFGTEILPLLAIDLPNLYSIELGPFMGRQRPLTSEAVQWIEESLEAFKHLTTLELDKPVYNTETEIRVQHTTSGDAETLMAWGQSCPTLVMCRLRKQLFLASAWKGALTRSWVHR